MKFETMVECMDKNCRTVVVAKHTDGLRCVRCGGVTSPMPFKRIGQDKSKELTIQVNVDNAKALEGIKEVTEAANECVAAFEKLETIINRFKGDNESKEQVIKARFLNEKVMAEAIAEFKKNAKFSL